MIKTELAPHFKFSRQQHQLGDLLLYPLCNEGGVEQVLPTLKAKRATKPGGVGLVVGSGAIYSLLPHLDLDALIVVDINPAVLGVTKMVGACIASSDTAIEAEKRIFKYFPYGLHQDHESTPRTPWDIKLQFMDKLACEKRYFGQTHWTNPDVFPRTKDALQSTTIAFANRNIADMEFYYELAGILEQTDQPLNYINFSNVHYWLQSNRHLLEITELLDPESVIQFANRGLETLSPLTMRLADSPVDFQRKTAEI